MSKNTYNIGDKVLILGPSHLEISIIKEITTTGFKLENNILTDKNLVPTNSSMRIKIFNQNEYDYLNAKFNIPRLLTRLKQEHAELAPDVVLTINRKLVKLVKKYL